MKDVILMEKSVFVVDIRDGTDVDAPFYVQQAELKEGRRGKYIVCALTDRTGTIACKIWGRGPAGGDEVEQAFSKLREGGIYRICGYAKTFRDLCEVNVNDGVRHLTDPIVIEAASHRDYLHAPTDVERNTSAIHDLIAAIGDELLRTLVRSVIVGEAGFFEKPAAKFRHHEYFGGLAEHTLEVARIVCSFADQIAVPIDRDLALAGALLHDIGKCRSFEQSGPGFIALPAYDLIGHITLGIQILMEHRGGLGEDRFDHLLHIIQSHHGPYGEIKPHTSEAWAVHLADLSSATLREVAADTATLLPGELKRRGAKSGEPVYRFPENPEK
jgi:3'-5' exoribonuclease